MKPIIIMTELLKKYAMVSLGATCGPKKFIDNHVKKEAFQIFDFIGTSMWSIVELLKNDFDGLLSKENISTMLVTLPKSKMPVNQKYYVRFMHDLMDSRHINETFEKNNRRINRFRDILKQTEPVIFFRLEEIQKDRIKYDRYNEYTKRKDSEYVIEMSKWLKINTKLKFRILYLGSENTRYDTDNDIIFIKSDPEDKYGWDDCLIGMDNTFNKNKKVIEEGLKDF